MAEPREHRVRIGGAAISPASTRLGCGVCAPLEQERQCEHPQPPARRSRVSSKSRPPRAANPSPEPHRLEEESERLPERTACGALRFAAVQPRVVRAHPGVFTSSLPTMYAATKALEILAAQLPLAMRRRQTGKRVPPHPTLERSAASLYSISDGHRLHDMPGRALRHASPFVRRRRH